MVHGKEEALKAEASAKALFSGAGESDHMPTTELSEADLNNGSMDILSLLVRSGLCSTRSDARRNVQQGGVMVNDDKVTDIAASFDEAVLRRGLLLRRGKKNFQKILLK